MAERSLAVDIVTPEKSVFSDKNVAMISLPAALGRVGILPGHMPLVSTLLPGELHLDEQSGGRKSMTIGSGFLQVKDNQVIVLVEEAKENSAS